MILVHRLRGEPMFLNADLIESIEATPDTTITLVDGRKALVAETPDVLVRRVMDFRAAVLLAADQLRDGASAPPAAAPPPAADPPPAARLTLLSDQES